MILLVIDLEPTGILGVTGEPWSDLVGIGLKAKVPSWFGGGVVRLGRMDLGPQSGKSGLVERKPVVQILPAGEILGKEFLRPSGSAGINSKDSLDLGMQGLQDRHDLGCNPSSVVRFDHDAEQVLHKGRKSIDCKLGLEEKPGDASLKGIQGISEVGVQFERKSLGGKVFVVKRVEVSPQVNQGTESRADEVIAVQSGLVQTGRCFIHQGSQTGLEVDKLTIGFRESPRSLESKGTIQIVC